MHRTTTIRLALIGGAIALAALTGVLLQQPNVQAGIGAVAIGAGVLVVALAGRKQADPSGGCTGCGTSEDWGLGFCHHCGHDDAR